jgi:hypothetical protein
VNAKTYWGSLGCQDCFKVSGRSQPIGTTRHFESPTFRRSEFWSSWPCWYEVLGPPVWTHQESLAALDAALDRGWEGFPVEFGLEETEWELVDVPASVRHI